MSYKILITENDIKNIVNKTISKFLLKEYGSEQRLPFDDDRFKNKNYFEQYLDWLEDFGKYGKLSPSNDDFWDEIKRAVEYIIENNIGQREDLGFFGKDPEKIFNELKHDIIKNHLSFNEDGNLYVEREVKINGFVQQYDKSDNKRTDPKVLYNSLVQNYQNNVGGCWSYRKGKAESYCSTANGDSIVLKGYIRIEDIDFIKTVLLNFYYDDEHEIRVKPKAKVELFEVICNCKYKMPLKGHLIVNATYFGNNGKYKKNYAPVDDGFGNKSMNYIDRKGNIKNIQQIVNDALSKGETIDSVFDNVKKFNEKYLKVELNDKFSLIKANNGKLIGDGKLWFDSISGILGNFAQVELNDKFSLINLNGELIGDGKLWFDKIVSFDGKYFTVQNYRDYSLLDINGKLIGDGKLWFDSIGSFYEGMAEVEKDFKYSFIREDGTLIGNGNLWFDSVSSFKNNMAIVREGDKYSLLTLKGELVDNGKLWVDYVYPFKEGFAPVYIGHQFSFINEKGKLIGGGKMMFDDVYNFSEGFGRVNLNGKWNYVTYDEKLLSPNQWFEYATDFKNGFATVMVDKKKYLIDSKGNIKENN